VPALAAVLSAGQGAQKPAPKGAGSPSSQSSPKPSLDVLLSRVNTYWGLMGRGQKSQALQLVEPSGRDLFLARQTPTFTEPRVTALKLSSKPVRISVAVTVKRMIPEMAVAMDWLVPEDWVFRNGNWYLLVEQPIPPFASTSRAPGQPLKPALSPEEVEKRQKELKEALQFEGSGLTFGTVRKGTAVPLSLTYQLTGPEYVEAALKNVPTDLLLSLGDGKLPAGKDQKISMDLVTQNYDGEVNESFAIIARYRDVDVPYEFKVHGFVYTPVSVLPMTLKFLRGEREKELVVKNNSRSEVTIVQGFGDGLTVGPLPQTLSPGADCRLKVTASLNKQDRNYGSTLTLSLDKPVEDMGSAEVHVILNYEDPKPRDTQKELEELLRKTIKKIP